jgi:hypothetical protein
MGEEGEGIWEQEGRQQEGKPGRNWMAKMNFPLCTVWPRKVLPCNEFFTKSKGTFKKPRLSGLSGCRGQGSVLLHEGLIIDSVKTVHEQIKEEKKHAIFFFLL